jgi:hypothetical protein
MEYETFLQISKNEADFALGKAYIELAAKGIGVKKDALIAALKTHIKNGEKEAKKAAFYDFLIELTTLTFLLYKWGLLLFHLDQNTARNLILTFLVDTKRAIIVEDDGRLRVEELEDQRVILTIDNKGKSALFYALLELTQRQTALEILAPSSDAQRFDGNRVCFDNDRKEARSKEIAFIKEEFFRYKKRLDDLQKLFIENFGRPSGMNA